MERRDFLASLLLTPIIGERLQRRWPIDPKTPAGEQVLLRARIGSLVWVRTWDPTWWKTTGETGGHLENIRQLRVVRKIVQVENHLDLIDPWARGGGRQVQVVVTLEGLEGVQRRVFNSTQIVEMGPESLTVTVNVDPTQEPLLNHPWL